MVLSSEQVLLTWGEANHPFTLRNACEGVLIVGANGSGKSSASGRTLALAYLLNNFGFLVPTVKPGDAADWIRYAQAAGRESDLLIVRPDEDCGLRFNFLDYEMTRPGRGRGITENIVAVLSNVLSPSVAARSTSSDEFWEKVLQELLRAAVDTVNLAGAKLTLTVLAEVVLSAPHSAEEERSHGFLERSLCAQLLRQAFLRTDLTAAQRGDLDHTLSYWGARFPRLAEKTRSIIEQSLSSMVDGLLRAPLRELLCTDSTFTPEDSQAGKIIVLDMPIAEFGDAGRLAQLIVKTVWMAAVGRRDVALNPRPVALWQDECQMFLSPADKHFAQKCRDRHAAVVSLTQNLSGMYSAMQAPDSRAAIDSYTGCLNTVIFHANSDAATMEYAERLFGREERFRGGGSFSIEGNVIALWQVDEVVQFWAILSVESFGNEIRVSEKTGYQWWIPWSARTRVLGLPVRWTVGRVTKGLWEKLEIWPLDGFFRHPSMLAVHSLMAMLVLPFGLALWTWRAFTAARKRDRFIHWHNPERGDSLDLALLQNERQLRPLRFNYWTVENLVQSNGTPAYPNILERIDARRELVGAAVTQAIEEAVNSSTHHPAISPHPAAFPLRPTGS